MRLGFCPAAELPASSPTCRASRRLQIAARCFHFQLGMVMWFLATGRIAAGVPARRSNPLGDDFYNLVSALLSESPDDRPQTAAAVRDELEKLRAITALT
jgi:hypothetical protein